MKYSRSYKDYHPMIERQPKPDSGFGAAIVGIAYGMILAAMYLGWMA